MTRWNNPAVAWIVALLLALAAVMAVLTWHFWFGADTDRAPTDQTQSPSEPVAPEGMVFVPAGEFMMGCHPEDDDCDERDLKWQKEETGAYFIDVTPVTVGDYKACLDAGRCFSVSRSDSCDINHAGRDNRAMNCMIMEKAKDYCLWQDKRLPTEAEWQKAARGGCELYEDCEEDSPIYPWGNDEPDCDRAVMHIPGEWVGCGRGETWPVGQKPAGASPYGVLDMVGTASEWTTDYFHEEDKAPGAKPKPWAKRVVMTHGINGKAEQLAISRRIGSAPDYVGGGFRCVRDVD